MKTDMFGSDIFVGDIIAFAHSGQGTYIQTAKVLDFRDEEVDDYSSWDQTLCKYTKTKIAINVRVTYPDGVRRWIGHDRQFVKNRKDIMRNDLTEVVVILDRSGSMGMNGLWDDSVGALDHFVNEQKKITGECKYTLVVFDSQSTDIIHTAEDVKTVGDFPTNIQPRGGTPLLDAMGQTINSFIERYDTTLDADKPGGVIFAIITDGGENDSKNFKKADVVQTIKDKTDALDWKFIYLSSDINAFDDAREYQFATQNTVSMKNTGKAFAKGVHTLNVFATSYRTSSLDTKASLMYADSIDKDDEDLKLASEIETETDEDTTS